jgi:hypothetical protein
LSKVLDVAGMDLVAFGELVNSLPDTPKPLPQKRRREMQQQPAKA